jgi:hypothetical protein
MTAEYDHGGRNCPWSVIVKTPFRRRGRWFGLRRSWLSAQVKLPFGEKLPVGRWGIVVGWWRYPDDDGWSALLKAVRLGRTDGDEAVNFESPTGASIRRALRIISGRRGDDAGDAGADG